MKKTLLTLGAILGISAGAFAQGTLLVENSQQPQGAGFNSVSSSPADTGAGGTFSDFPTGTITLEIFSIAASGNASLASQINADAASAATEQTALGLITSDFTQQAYGSSVSSESLSSTWNITGGDFSGSQAGSTITIGTAGTLTSGSSVYYALVAILGSREGVLVLNADGPYEAGGGQNPAASMNADWPDQNLLLAPVPEPTTLALAGLGGLSMLFLRRRKA